MTLVYRDPPGNPGFLPHRINDISLEVISPLGTVYFGNNGLTEGNASTPDGAANSVDTKENVWVNGPTPGAWTVEILGADINTDLYPAIGGNNADFSLWITGATEGSCSSSQPVNYCTAGISASGCVAAISASGTASASAPSGFVVTAAGVEGDNHGLFFFGQNGRQAIPWGNGTSYQCVVPPVHRAGVLPGTGTTGGCDGHFCRILTVTGARPARSRTTTRAPVPRSRRSSGTATRSRPQTRPRASPTRSSSASLRDRRPGNLEGSPEVLCNPRADAVPG